jgi:hypothetical protein
MAQPVNGTGDHRTGQTRRPRGVKTPRFPQRIYRRRLRLWKIKVLRSPSGVGHSRGMGKPHCSLRTHLWTNLWTTSCG